MTARPRILITGRSGQLGWELMRSLAPLGELIAVDRSQLDLSDTAAIRASIRKLRPQWIVNPAAYTAVDAAEREAAVAEAINGAAPGVMAEEAAALKAKFIHFSTDYVFDGSGSSPYRETDPVAPQSAYGRSKLAGEVLALAAGGNSWVFRTSWLYATRGRNFLLTMLHLARQQPKLRVVADQLGSPTTARLVASAVAAFISAEQRQAKVEPGVYHLTSRGATSWHGFASKIVEWGAEQGLCPLVPVEPITTSEYPTPARRPHWSVLDCSLIEQRSGIALPDWQQGLRMCLDELGKPLQT